MKLPRSFISHACFSTARLLGPMRLALGPLAFVLIPIGSATAATPDAPTCTAMYQQKCEVFRAEKNPIAKRLPDGSVLPNPYVFLQAKESEAASRILGDDPTLRAFDDGLTPRPAGRLAIQELFKKMKPLFEEKIRGGTAKEALSPRQIALLERFRTMELELSMGSCERLEFDAQYIPERNTMKICPALQNLPLEALIPALAHEFAHATSPCLLEVFTFDLDKVAALEAEDSTARDVCGISKADATDLADAVRVLTSAGWKGLIPPVDERAEIFLMMHSCGLLKEPAYRPTATDQAGQPFQKMLSCSDQIPAKMFVQFSPDYYEKLAAEKNSSQRKFKWRAPTSSLINSPSCQLKRQEAYADHVAAEITAHYVSQNSNSLRKGAVSDVLSFYVLENCMSADTERVRYPRSNERIAAFLQYPEIQRQLACSGQVEKPLCGLDGTVNEDPQSRVARSAASISASASTNSQKSFEVCARRVHPDCFSLAPIEASPVSAKAGHLPLRLTRERYHSLESRAFEKENATAALQAAFDRLHAKAEREDRKLAKASPRSLIKEGPCPLSQTITLRKGDDSPINACARDVSDELAKFRKEAAQLFASPAK